jgi:heme/copper-type cytochrome/quinol oxidase subunit 3
MMNEEMMKHGAGMMGTGAGMMSHPVAKGAMMAATGYAATRALVGQGLLRNPLLLLAGGIAGGIAVGYLLHKHEKEVVLAISKAIGMGKDFVMQQRENLDDLVAEAKETEAQAAAAPAAAVEPGPDAQA